MAATTSVCGRLADGSFEVRHLIVGVGQADPEHGGHGRRADGGGCRGRETDARRMQRA